MRTTDADVDFWNRLIQSKSNGKQKEELLTAHPTVVIPNNIRIERLAFVDSGVTEVVFATDPPRGVTVQYGAFKHCDKKMTKEMKQSIKNLNANAFK